MTDDDLIKLLRSIATLVELCGDFGADLAIADPTVFSHTANLLEQKNAELETLRAESVWLTQILNSQL